MLRRFYQNHRVKLEKLDQFLLGNPILERGLVLAPVVVTCTSLWNALFLSASFSIITVFTICITFFIPKKLPYTIRVILNAAIATFLFIPLSLLIRQKWPEMILSLGVYLPLLATNSLIVQKSESRYHHESFPVMLIQLLSACLGFTVTAFLVALVRELFGKGTLFGIAVNGIQITTPALLLPFCGFLLLGFLAAILQKIRLYLEKPPRRKQRKETHHV
ncbi:MAG: Rnf-Nqr domain containing protein [Candidatus Merdivicinus sp.]